MHCETN